MVVVDVLKDFCFGVVVGGYGGVVELGDGDVGLEVGLVLYVVYVDYDGCWMGVVCFGG